MTKTLDAIVVGQGLAGTSLAWALLTRGASIHIYDPQLASASSVAAGLVTPVTGRALRQPADFLCYRQTAAAHYRTIERQLGQRLWFARPALRLAQTMQQRDKLHARLATADSGLGRAHRPPTAGWRNALAFAAMPGAGRLDVANYVTASRQHYIECGLFTAAHVRPADVSPQSDAVHVPALNVRARYLVWCRGYLDADNPYLPETAISPAKGEILDLALPGWTDRRTTHCAGHWLVPGSHDGRAAFGATYDHGDLSLTPTAAAREQLVARAETLLDVPFTVTGQRAGIRPVGRQRLPLVGSHPVHRQILTFNGLGSKGVLWAPREADRLATMMLSDGAVRAL